VHLVPAKQEAQAAGKQEEEEKEAQDEKADLGDEDEPTEEAAVRTSPTALPALL